MEVFFSELAEYKLKKLKDYLLEKWSYNVKEAFLKKLDTKINQISSQPESCPKSSRFNGIYKCVVTSQTTFFYRVDFENREIEIIPLIDTRQNPDTLQHQLE